MKKHTQRKISKRKPNKRNLKKTKIKKGGMHCDSAERRSIARKFLRDIESTQKRSFTGRLINRRYNKFDKKAIELAVEKECKMRYK